jgi:5-methylcytosine-specific restriction endonuclease McrA
MADANIAPLLRCRTCEIEKPLPAFTRNGRKPHGVDRQCKECRSAMRKAAYAADPTYDKDAARRWREANRLKVRAMNRRWKEENKDKMTAYVRQFYERNPEKRAEYSQRFKVENPEQYKRLTKVSNARRRARLNEAEGSHSAADVQAKLEGQHRRCWHCSKKLKNYHVDHLIPLSRGGSNGPENIVIACPKCNLRKHNKLPWEMDDPRLI